MIITIVGGGSTFTPGIVKSIALRQKDLDVHEIRLFDIDEERQYKVSVVVDYILKEMNSPIKLTVTTIPEIAYKDATFIFAQMRVGKYEMRIHDEQIPLKYGCVGQETCGLGGLAYGLRTIFPMMKVIDDVEKYANKDYWILNYSNPAAVVSEACRVLRPNARIINICDMPIAILEMISKCVKDASDYESYKVDYFGLNHFGWFTSIDYQGRNIMEEAKEYILKHETLLPEVYIEKIKQTKSEEIVRHVSNSWLHTWASENEMLKLFPDYLPNTYLNYYFLSKESVAHSNPTYTRANEVINSREKNLFEGVDHYLKTGEITKEAFYHGAHGNFIADLAVSIKNDENKEFIVIVENKGIIPNVANDAMIEVPLKIGKNGPVYAKRDEIPLFYKAMMDQQLASEKLLVEGAIEGDYLKVLQSFSLNKTVNSANDAKAILDEMIEVNKAYWPTLK